MAQVYHPAVMPGLSNAEFYSRWRTHLRSPAWKAKREQVFALQGRRCAVCGATHRLQIHHLTYWKGGSLIFGREDARSDLRVLCKKHHPKGRLSASQIRSWNTDLALAGWLSFLCFLPFLLLWKLFVALTRAARRGRRGRRG